MERSDVLCICALKLGETISGSTLGSLDGIDLIVTTMPCCDENREVSINMNRATAQHYASKFATKYKAVILIDGDVVATRESVDTLLENYNADGCVAVRTKENSEGHIFCSFCILPMIMYLGLNYFGKGQCQCSMIAGKMDVKYIENVKVSEK